MKKLIFYILFLSNSMLAYNQTIPVQFLEKEPVIDGILDQNLQNLTVRNFTFYKKTNDLNVEIPCNYRLAYGTNFLYVYIEYQSDSVIFRNRGHQNGDGFIMTIAKPKPNNESTDEFYVLGFSAQIKHSTERRKVIWYYNINLSYKALIDSKFEYSCKNGKVGFETFIPWSEIYPYHPWFGEIGLNICFVKAIGKSDKNYYFIANDERIQSEQSLRKYVKFDFEKPELSEGTQTVIMPDKNNLGVSDSLKIKIASVSGYKSKENISYAIITGDKNRVIRSTYSFESSEKLSYNNFTINIFNLLPEGYILKWSSADESSKGEIPLCILKNTDFSKFRNSLSDLKNKISEGSYTTLLFYIEDLEFRYSNLKTYETSYQIRSESAKIDYIIEQANAGNDILAKQTGIFRRSFLSNVDNTLQPYSVKVPANFDKNKKYPLFVFLHGSGQDDTGILDFVDYTENNYIEIAPKARGTSNCYTTEHAQTDINEAIADVLKNYNIDSTKIILAGFSMGGYGVYRTYYETPKRFKALVVLSGHPNLATKWIGEGHPDFMEDKNLNVFKNIPMFIFHGKNDNNCPFELTEQLVGKLKKAGAKVTFIIEEKGHEAMTNENKQVLKNWLYTIVR